MNRTPETPRSFLSESTPEFVVSSPELAELNITEIMHMTVVEISSSRVNKVSSFQERLLADHCWRTEVSSSSSSEEKKSDDGWFLGVLGEDSDCEGSHQLGVFEKDATEQSTWDVKQDKTVGKIMLHITPDQRVHIREHQDNPIST